MSVVSGVSKCMYQVAHQNGIVFDYLEALRGREREKAGFWSQTTAFLNGPLGCLLRAFACTAHSTHSFHNAALPYTLFKGSLTLKERD